MKEETIQDIKLGLETAYIDGSVVSNTVYRPQFVSNNHKEGKKVLKTVYGQVGSFKEGLARIEKNGRCGFIDKKGKKIVKPVYEASSKFEKGLACVRRNGKWGYINKKGEEVVKPIYDAVSNFDDEIVFVQKDDNWYIIDLKNPTYEVLIDLQDKAIKKQFSDESKADEFLNAISSYIEKRSQIKNEEENEVNKIFELLKKQYEKDILKINNSYKDDIEKEFNNCYKKSMN